MKKSICGEDDCPTPYEFCEACIRADERERIGAEALLVSIERDTYLRAKVEALPTVGGVTMPYVKGAEHRYELIYRGDVLTLLDGGQP